MTLSRIILSVAGATLVGLMLVSPAVAQTPSATLQQLFADEREFLWREDPLAATTDGMHAYDDRLPSVTPATQTRRLDTDRGFLHACTPSTAPR